MDKIICIAGKNDIAINALKFCIEKYNKKFVYFLPNNTDDGIDRWQKSFKSFALSEGIREVKIEEIFEIKNLIFISLEYSEIININKFESKDLYNIHFSLLPKYKGMYTSAWPIINGEDHSGVTLHKIDCGIDTGDIIDQKSFKLSKNETARSLYFKYLKYSESLFLENFYSLLDKSYKCYPQSHIASSYYSKKSIDYSNLNINFNKTAYEVNNQIRAFNFREYQLPKFLDWKISKGIINSDRSKLKPGSLVSENEEGFTIATIDFDVFLQKDYYEIFWNCCQDNDLNYLRKIIKKINEIDLKIIKAGML